MIMLNLQGIFPALITPYCADGSIDGAALHHLVQQLAPHVDGFLVNGTTGDFPLLTRAERRQCIDIAIAATGGTLPIFAGTGAIATDEALVLTRDAQEAGAAAALVVMPYYLRPSAAGILHHYTTIAAAVPTLPILLYNIPQLAGQAITPDTVAALTHAAPNVIGLKDTSGDMRYMLSIVQMIPAPFQTLVGQGTLLLPALAMGATGGILAAATLIPQTFRAMFRAVNENDWETARILQRRAYPVARLVGQYGSLAVRAGLELLGLPVGRPRPPLTAEGTMTAADIETLRQALRACAE